MPTAETTIVATQNQIGATFASAHASGIAVSVPMVPGAMGEKPAPKDVAMIVAQRGGG